MWSSADITHNDLVSDKTEMPDRTIEERFVFLYSCNVEFKDIKNNNYSRQFADDQSDSELSYVCSYLYSSVM